MKRLKDELREHIRFLADYELLSMDWLRMAESLHQIANVAFMETHLPPSEDNPLTQQGKKEKGTLWDQERDELAVRILLEEGKLNLVLRILHKYRQATRDSTKFTELIQSASSKYQSDMTLIQERCHVFEQSVGLLLKLAFQHVEALQIMDVPEFIQHCAEVMKDALESNRTTPLTPVEGDKLQETMVLHYLSGLATALEELDEDRVMDLMHEHNLLPLTIAHLSKHYMWYNLAALESAAKFLNGCLSSESYQADRQRFIPKSGETIAQLVSLKTLLADLLKLDPVTTGLKLKKKDVQMLMDEITKYERTPGLQLTQPSSSETLKERLEKFKVAEMKEKAAAAAAAAKDGAASSSSSSTTK